MGFTSYRRSSRCGPEPKNKPKEAMGETLIKVRHYRGRSGVPPYDRRSDSLAICRLRAAVVLVGRSLPAHRWDARACSAGARLTSAAAARRLATTSWGLLVNIACRRWLTMVTASATAEANRAGR